nr:non-reducing end alpha-L-arabinofuranosidase family hydrolase [Catenulispora pinisilvae]
MSLFDRRAALAAVVATGLAVAGVAVATTAARAAAGCQVDYTVSSQWAGGFNAGISVTDQGDPVTSWQLTWSFGAGQTVTQLWNGNVTQSGGQVSVANAAYNGSIPSGGSVSLGFNGTWTGSNPVPTDFALNGVSCEGSQPPPTTPPTTPSTTPPTTSSTTPPTSPSSTPSTTPSSPGGSLPSSFRWSSSGILISPKSDATHNIIAVKDPSVVFYDNRWYVLMSTVDSNGNYGMAQTSFTDWSQAASAPLTYLDTTPIGGGYKTAPMVFYFAPQKLWYLTYQTGSNIGYSTNPDIGNPAGWSAPHSFYSNGMPSIIQQNIGGGYWVDSWVICDSANCDLFSADDNGHIYRSTSAISQFPNGFGNGSNTVIAASAPNKYDMFEADNVYKVDGSSTYLMVVEAVGSDGHRLFHSWTSDSLTGSWTPLAATQSNPFLAASNTTFSGTPWTQDLSSGEAIRSNYDQTVTISPCHLQYLYQGKDPSANQSYNLLPWRIGLATQTNSTC